MQKTQPAAATPAAYRVCEGKFFVNDERIPVHPRILRIGIVAAGLDAEHACAPIGERDARRILHMERAWLLTGLALELRRTPPGRAA
jgi:hypothetical protein